MPRASTLRAYLAEFVVVFVGVALAFAVDNFREARTLLEFFDGKPSVPIQFKGPWKDTPANRQSVETLLRDRRIENGLRLIVVNLDFDHESLLPLLESARLQVEQLLQQIPAR
jgi:hypothetical protein